MLASYRTRYTVEQGRGHSINRKFVHESGEQLIRSQQWVTHRLSSSSSRQWLTVSLRLVYRYSYRAYDK